MRNAGLSVAAIQLRMVNAERLMSSKLRLNVSILGINILFSAGWQKYIFNGFSSRFTHQKTG